MIIIVQRPLINKTFIKKYIAEFYSLQINMKGF